MERAPADPFELCIQMWIVSDQSKGAISRQVTLPGSDGRKPADVFVQLFSANNGQTSYRALVVSAGGTWSMFQSDSLLWNRYEALSNIDQVVFVEHVAGELLEMMQVEAATHQIPGFFERLQLQRLRYACARSLSSALASSPRMSSPSCNTACASWSLRLLRRS
jgi:hypothetical protein